MSRRTHPANSASRSGVFAACASALRGFARDGRGGGALEFALGSVALLSVSAVCFDLYSRISADTAVARMAIAMADYVSHDTAPDGDQMTALAEFLYEQELEVPADVVFVVTAIHQPPGNPAPALQVLWKDNRIQIGDATETANIALECARQVDTEGAATLPAAFTPMLESEVVIIAEVCVRLNREGALTGRFVAGDIYRLHALPARDTSQLPAAPTYT